MPFTPFHMGAGLLGKGLAPKSQSLYFFAACNIAFDIEPGVRMLLGHADLHTVTHNPVGLAVIAALCGWAWKRGQDKGWWPRRLPRLSTRQLVDTGFWAALSHLLLDAISHTDVWGSSLMHLGMAEAEGLAFGMAVAGLLLLGARWLIGAGAAFLSAHRPGRWSWRRGAARHSPKP